MEDDDVLGSADAAVHQLRELSDTLELRLKQRSQQPALDLHRAPHRPSAFTTAEDQKLLEMPPPPPITFPTSIDRQPGHTSHSFSPKRSKSPTRNGLKAGAAGGTLLGQPGPVLAAEASSPTARTSPVRRSGGLTSSLGQGASLSGTSVSMSGGAGAAAGGTGRMGAPSATAPPLSEAEALSREFLAAASSPAISYLVQAAASTAAYVQAEAEGRISPVRASMLAGSGTAHARTGQLYGSSGHQGHSQAGTRARGFASGGSATVTLVSASGMLPMPKPASVPGQRQYRQALAAAQGSRAAELSTFQREMAAIDTEINSYVSNFKYELNVPDAALAMQAAWRARGPRLLLSRYRAVREAALQRHARTFLTLLAQLARACMHGRCRLLRRCFQEWRDLVLLKLELYRKIIQRLKASMIDVRDSQSPNHLWHLCTAPGEDPWKARLSLGRLVANILLNQAPRRKTKLYFEAWLSSIRALMMRRRDAAAKLAAMEVRRTREQLLGAFRFWFRYAIVKVAARMDIEPPLFRPRMAEWDAWLWEHNRTRDLMARIAQLHRRFRLGYCFRWWHYFVDRNKRLRKAWSGAAAKQIEALLRYSLNSLKANWRYATFRRKTHTAVLKAWLALTRRNKEVRKISVRVQAISRRSILLLCMRRLRTYARMQRLLAAAAAVRMWQRRCLSLAVMYAWTGDTVHMWFALAFQRWRSAAVGRLRFKCLLAAHMQRRETNVGLELAFKAWRKVAVLRVHARNQAVDAERERLQQLQEQQEQMGSTPLHSKHPLWQLPDPGADVGDDLSPETSAADLRTLDWSNTFRPTRRGPLGRVPIVQEGSVRSPTSSLGASMANSPVKLPKERAASGRSALSRAGPGGEAAGGDGDGDSEADGQEAKQLGEGTPADPVPGAAAVLRASGGSAGGAKAGQEGRRASEPLSAHSGDVGAGEDSEQEALDAAARASDQAFDECDNILVTAADFPMTSSWRTATGRAALMRANDLNSAGISSGKVHQMVEQLTDLEGLFNPRLQSRQLVLDVYRRADVTPLQVMYLSTDHACAARWRESGRPDGVLWQRVVGLRATTDEPCPDYIAAVLLDEDALPLRQEVGLIQAANRAARCSPQLLSNFPEMGALLGSRGPAASVPAAAAAGAGEAGGAVTEPALGSQGAGTDLDAKQLDSEGVRQRQVEAAERVAALGLLLSGDQKETMFLYKLAESEQLLETCVCTLMGIGSYHLPTVYRLLGQRALPGHLQGDMLVTLLGSAIGHDITYMHANMVYCGNRDKVITMGLELHEKAKALHQHRPEFTLIYPDLEKDKSRKKGKGAKPPALKIDEILEGSSDSDIPSPRPKSPTQLLREEAEKAAGLAGLAEGKKPPALKIAMVVANLTGGVMSPSATALLSPATRGSLTATTPSKSHMIKLEMLGKDMSAASAAKGLGTPGASPKRAWLPKAATMTTIASATRASSPGLPWERGPGADSPTGTGVGTPDDPRRSNLGRQSVGGLPSVSGSGAPPGSGAGVSFERERSKSVDMERAKSAAAAHGGWRPAGHRAPPTAPSLSPGRISGRLRASQSNGGSRSASRRRSRSVGRSSTLGAKSVKRTHSSSALQQGAGAGGAAPGAAAGGAAGAAQGNASGAARAGPTAAQPGSETKAACPSTPPSTGYQWFTGTRLFPSIADVPVAADVPTMLDLEHVSQHLLGEVLPQFFAIPPLPAIVFTNWGQQTPPEELRPRPPGQEGQQQEGNWEDMAVAAWNAEVEGQGPGTGGRQAQEGLGHREGSSLMGSEDGGGSEDEKERERGGAGEERAEKAEGVGNAKGRSRPVVPALPLTAENLAASTRHGHGGISERRTVRIDEHDLDPSTHRSSHISDAMEDVGHTYRMLKSAESRIGDDVDAAALKAKAAATMVALLQKDQIYAAGEAAQEAMEELRASRQATEDGGPLGEDSTGSSARTSEESGGGDEAEDADGGQGGEVEAEDADLPEVRRASGDGDDTAPGPSIAEGGSGVEEAEPGGGHRQRRSTGCSAVEGVGGVEGVKGVGDELGAAASDQSRKRRSSGAVATPRSHRPSSAAAGLGEQPQQQVQWMGDAVSESDGRRSSGLEVTPRPTGDSGDGDESESVAGSQASDHGRRTRAAVERPVFVPTPRQIDIFLGGHLRGQRWRHQAAAEEEAARARAVDATADATGGGGNGGKPLTPANAFDPARVLQSDSIRDRTLLDGFDLQAELERVRGTKEHIPGLNPEMRALEVELAAVMGRKRPRRRHHHHGKARSHAGSVKSFGTLETSTILSMSSYQDEFPDQLSTVDRMVFGTAFEGPEGEQGSDAGSGAGHPQRGSTAPTAHQGQGDVLSPAVRTSGPPSPDIMGPRASTAPEQLGVLSPSKALALAGEEPGREADTQHPLSPWGQTPGSGGMVAHGESMRLSVRLRDYKPITLGREGGASMMPSSSRRPFGAMSELVELDGTPPHAPLAAALVDPALVFPDRPGTVDSRMGGYPESTTSSTAAAAALMQFGEDGRPHQRVGPLPRPGRASATGSVQSLVDSLGESTKGGDAGADLLFLTAVGGFGNKGATGRRRTNMRTGGQALQPLTAEAFAGRPPPAPIANPSTGTPGATPRSRPPSSGSAAAAPSLTPPPASPPPPLPPVPAELEAIPDAVSELAALQAMWSSKPYSGTDLSALQDQGPDPGEVVQQLIAQAEQDGWRQYEEGASRFVEELTGILSKDQKQAQDDQGRHGGPEREEHARTRQSHQLMKALAVMEDHVAASLDPDRLTGLHMDAYPSQLSSLLSRLVVAPMATKFLFWKKVQSLAALKQRLLEDKALQEQLKQVAWMESFDAPSLAPPSGAWVPERAAMGPRRGEQSMWFLGPSGMATVAAAGGGLEAHRAAWAPAGSLPPTGMSQPLRSSRIQLRPRDDSPPGAVNLTYSQASGTNFFSSRHGSTSPSRLGLATPQSLQGAAPYMSPAPDALLQPAQPPPPPRQQQQQQQAMLLMSAEDVAQLSAPPVRDQLLRQQQELMLQRRQVQAAMQAAAEEGGEALLYAPTVEEEQEVVEKLAQVTVALHRDTLRRAHRTAAQEAGLASGTAAFGRGTAVPQWLREPDGGREGFQASPDPWFHAPRHATAAMAAAAPPAVVSTHGSARPHASARSVQELATLAAGISGGRVASAALRPGAMADAGVVKLDEPTSRIHALPQGQSRPLRGPGAVPSPLAPIVNPPVFPAAAAQPGNVQMPLPRHSAYVDRGAGSPVRPSAVSASAVTLSARSVIRKGGASPQRRSLPGLTEASTAQLRPPGSAGSMPGPWGLDHEASHGPLGQEVEDKEGAGQRPPAASSGSSPSKGGAGRALAGSPLQAWDEGTV